MGGDERTMRILFWLNLSCLPSRAHPVKWSMACATLAGAIQTAIRATRKQLGGVPLISEYSCDSYTSLISETGIVHSSRVSVQ